VWVDDEHFDIVHHIHASRLTGGGDESELRSFINGILDTRLDAARPLWDMWFIDGIADGRVAGVLRVHHVMADGLTLLDAALLVLDMEPRADPDAPAPWTPRSAPGPAELLLRSLADRVRHQVHFALSAPRAVLDPRWLLGTARAVGGLRHVGSSMAPSLPITARVGPHRDITWMSLPMADLLDVKHARGTTINDVMLAIVTGAVRKHLDTKDLDRRPRVLVPVGNVGTEESHGAGNQFSMVVADLPVDIDDPLDRLASLHEQMTQAKASGQASAMTNLFSVVDLVPLQALRTLAPEAMARQPFVNLALTNVPGSRTPGYLLGAQLESLHPIVTGAGNIAVIIGVMSYVDLMGVAITVDPEVVTDPDHLMESFREAAHELIQLCR
jgi:WS/DGAT/MGAT family acyltransferase